MKILQVSTRRFKEHKKSTIIYLPENQPYYDQVDFKNFRAISLIKFRCRNGYSLDLSWKFRFHLGFLIS